MKFHITTFMFLGLAATSVMALATINQARDNDIGIDGEESKYERSPVLDIDDAKAKYERNVIWTKVYGAPLTANVPADMRHPENGAFQAQANPVQRFSIPSVQYADLVVTAAYGGTSVLSYSGEVLLLPYPHSKVALPTV
ncbi:uncharacterized protein RSE6_14195 [Rhynchosporium secalis]|uniref:Uncharacterized protein n=1 Tax=Rhynchosporium secalis TaxID=38038 RepID=A0A1E1MVE5_RHYSE|nr:uncharacterized protein RSE6_14195 [Rhynchosporium secalis]